jgi:hypothetical protein
VAGVVCVSGGDTDEQILVAFAREQIAIPERVLAEFGEERVAAVIDLDRVDLRAHRVAVLRLARGLRSLGFGGCSGLFDRVRGHVAIPAAVSEIHRNRS